MFLIVVGVGVVSGVICDDLFSGIDVLVVLFLVVGIDVLEVMEG